MAEERSGQAPQEPELKGIGGWLLLPPVHLILNAGIVCYTFTTSFIRGYNTPPAGSGGPQVGGIVAMFTTPPMLASLGVALLGILLVLYSLFALIRLLQRKKGAPKVMIGFYILLTTMNVANAVAIYFFPALLDNPKDVQAAYMGVFRVLVACAIWIPYFIVSKRVKNTFVR